MSNAYFTDLESFTSRTDTPMPGKSVMPDHSELTVDLACKAFEIIDSNTFTVRATLDVTQPDTLKNFGTLESILLMAYNAGKAAQADDERERCASSLAVTIRSLRKYGFYIARDPDAAKLPDADQERQTREAACVLLAMPITDEKAANHGVQELARALQETSAVALERLHGRV